MAVAGRSRARSCAQELPFWRGAHVYTSSSARYTFPHLPLRPFAPPFASRRILAARTCINRLTRKGKRKLWERRFPRLVCGRKLRRGRSRPRRLVKLTGSRARTRTLYS